MNKNSLKKTIVCLVIGLAAFNFYPGLTNKKQSADIELTNLEALNASAAEAYCDQSDNTSCKIIMGDISGYSTGNIRGTAGM